MDTNERAFVLAKARAEEYMGAEMKIEGSYAQYAYTREALSFAFYNALQKGSPEVRQLLYAEGRKELERLLDFLKNQYSSKRKPKKK